uniref:Immunoglobulin V-set domain-containing protein n=1 Tax=Oryzias sinensis TaxID=183150 RepID=A0A8C8DJ76_9TELE
MEFSPGEEILIHWHLTRGNVVVHSFYENGDQLAQQSQQFKGRTSMFKDQISEGNASLQLTEVRVQDKGRYECYTSTLKEDFFVYLKAQPDVEIINHHFI